ncbi:MAG: hypothetical protein MJE63_12730, partial [Proteobacteria bacterium]|nr:hypothetical protein [Pseudomonadota bacterium]
ENLKEGVSKTRNRVIALIFREPTLIEQWGSDLHRISDKAKSSKRKQLFHGAVASQLKQRNYVKHLDRFYI